jgi:hypothetical protein
MEGWRQSTQRHSPVWVQEVFEVSSGSKQPTGPHLLLTEMQGKLSCAEIDEQEKTRASASSSRTFGAHCAYFGTYLTGTNEPHDEHECQRSLSATRIGEGKSGSPAEHK